MEELLFMTWRIFILSIMYLLPVCKSNIKISFAEDTIDALEIHLEMKAKGEKYNLFLMKIQTIHGNNYNNPEQSI